MHCQLFSIASDFRYANRKYFQSKHFCFLYFPLLSDLYLYVRSITTFDRTTLSSHLYWSLEADDSDTATIIARKAHPPWPASMLRKADSIKSLFHNIQYRQQQHIRTRNSCQDMKRLSTQIFATSTDSKDRSAKAA